MADEDEIAMLIATLQSRRGGPAVRAQAARLLGETGDPRAVEPLLAQIEDTADPFRVPIVTAALEALPRLGAAAEPALLSILDDRGDPRRHYVPRLLAEATGARAAATLVALLHDADDEVAMNAATTLGALHDPAYAAALRAIVDDEAQPSLRRGVAASALGTSGAPGAYETLAPLLGSGDEHLFAGAVDGLAELGDSRAIPLIQAVLAGGGLDERTTRGAKLALISLRARR